MEENYKRQKYLQLKPIKAELIKDYKESIMQGVVPEPPDIDYLYGTNTNT
jgi:hypothetical protein